MYKQFLAVLFLFFSLMLVGCSDNSNQTYGAAPMPTPAPEPVLEPVLEPTVRDTVIGTVTDPTGLKPLAGVKVVFTNPQGQVTEVLTDAAGNFSIDIDGLRGSELILSFIKEGYYIEPISVTIPSEGQALDALQVLAYLMLRADNVAYQIDVLLDGVSSPRYSAITADGKYLYVSLNCTIVCFDTATSDQIVIAGNAGESGYVDGPGNDARFGVSSMGIALSYDEDTLFVSDRTKIRKITGVKNAVTSSDVTVYTIAGTNTGGYVDGPGNEARFNSGFGLALSPDGNTLYKGEPDASKRGIRAITGVKNALEPSGTTVWTLAGNTYGGNADGAGDSAQFCYPDDVKLSSDGDTLYVADAGDSTSGNKIRKITGVKNATSSADVTVYTIAGSVDGTFGNVPSGNETVSGSAARFNWNTGLALSEDDDTIFVSDTNNGVIKMITGVKNALSGDDTEVMNMTYDYGSIYARGLASFRYGSILYVCDDNWYRILRITAKEN